MTIKVSGSEHLMTALKALGKSKEGLSNSELDYSLSNNSEWMTIWVTRQLVSLGFVTYKVDFFGNPARYALTDLGRDVLQRLTAPTAPKPPQQASIPTHAAPSPAAPASPQAKQTQT
jgi:hypothetical protein